MVLDKTVKLDSEIKNKLDRLDFVSKNHTYNEIISTLIQEYKKKKSVKKWGK
jgi:predicted transcriptional regulator